MKKLIARASNFALLSVMLPFVYGCTGGGGGALGFLGGGGGSPFFFGDGGFASIFSSPGSSFITDSGFTTTSSSIAVITNPEPASMFLLGSGLAAMAFFKSKKR